MVPFDETQNPCPKHASCFFWFWNFLIFVFLFLTRNFETATHCTPRPKYAMFFNTLTEKRHHFMKHKTHVPNTLHVSFVLEFSDFLCFLFLNRNFESATHCTPQPKYAMFFNTLTKKRHHFMKHKTKVPTRFVLLFLVPLGLELGFFLRSNGACVGQVDATIRNVHLSCGTIDWKFCCRLVRGSFR